MTRSEADTDRELDEEDESDSADSNNLAKFLTPVPKPKSSAPSAPPSSALRAAPVPKERVSLFSDLPVPRKNSSLRPPVAVTESPHPERLPADASHPRAEHADTPAADMPHAEESTLPPWRGKARPRLGGFDETESPTASITLEQSLRDEDLERDLDLIPMSRPPIGRASARRAVIAAGALIAILGIAIVAKRAMSPTRTAGPSSAAPPIAEAPREPNAPTANTLEPTDDLAFEPSAADPTKAAELRRQARQLLEKGSSEEGVQLARRAIQADPNEAEGYILLAAGLQDLGRWQESRDVFAKCVQESNRKANAECVYFATRSK